MAQDSFHFHVKFPGSIEFIPAVRKYVSETLLANNFDPKFTYRSEIVVDEICNNAVTHGCVSVDALVELLCTVHGDRIEFEIKDEGGTQENIQKLQKALKERPRRPAAKAPDKEGLGIEIVRMLCDELFFEVDPNNLTTVRVVKVREDDGVDGSEDGPVAS